MSQLNMHLTAEFEAELKKFMKIRQIKTKSEAVRVAIHEGLVRLIGQATHKDFSDWVGLANQAPLNKKTKFKSDDDLWS